MRSAEGITYLVGGTVIIIAVLMLYLVLSDKPKRGRK